MILGGKPVFVEPMGEYALSMKRDTYLGQLNPNDADKEICVAGWVNARRDLGGMVFVEMRDNSGKLQLVSDPNKNKEAHDLFVKLKSECVLIARGKLSQRPQGTEKPEQPNGLLELYPDQVEILNMASPLPFQIELGRSVDESLRLKYRYLDLRRRDMQKNLMLRHRVTTAIRNYLVSFNFIEVETPILTRATPEGARDFLVPSRLNAGSWYALPQSPQLFKQTLMISGIERYYQIARCFRDEDLRADRQPEFTQVDIEMAFIDEADIQAVTEGLLKSAFSEAGVELEIPFRRITHEEAMAKYGSDKPDLRFGLEFNDLSEVAAACDFKVFRGAVESGGQLKSICLSGQQGKVSRKQYDGYQDFAKQCGAKGLAWIEFQPEGKIRTSGIEKFLKPEEIERMKELSGAGEGDIILLVADSRSVVANVLGRLRLKLAEEFGLIDENRHEMVWVVDFPLFEYNEDEKRLEAVHHPFTSPRPEDIDKLSDEPEAVLARAYDIVYNGVEIGGGSIRIHSKEMQDKVFSAIGIDERTASDKFGFLLDALASGAPPHGGIALGLDRLIMMLAGAKSIREVIAFPKTQSGTCLMTDAPSVAPEEQLKDLQVQSTAKSTFKSNAKNAAEESKEKIAAEHS